MKKSRKTKINKFSDTVITIKELLNDSPFKQLLIFKGTEKEVIVDFEKNTYKMYPFGTVLLYLLNRPFRIMERMLVTFEDKYSDLMPSPDSYIHFFVEATCKSILENSKNNKTTNKDLSSNEMNIYSKEIDKFIDIFINKNNLSFIQTPNCMTLRASEFIIPFSKNLQKDSYLNIYFYKSLTDIFGVYTKLFLENNIPLRQCKNCEKYFIPINKSNETLCNNIYKNNKTCKQLSAELKLKNDDILHMYRTAYKRENGKKNRYKHIPNIQEKFENWNKIAKEKCSYCQNKTISKEEFSEWLNSSRNWHKD